MMKTLQKSQLTSLCSTFKSLKRIGLCVILLALISPSCQKPERPQNRLNLEAKNASKEFSLYVLPDELGKFAFKNKFVGIIPRKLAEGSAQQEIELYVVDAPTFKFEEFTVENIKKQKLTPKRITSLDQLAAELASSQLGFDNFTVVAKKEKTVKDGEMTVKDLDKKTVVNCTCPCSVEFDDGEKFSCR